MRATILLQCSQGKTNIEIMEETGTHKKTISKWRKRWAKNKNKLTTIENQEKGIAYQRKIEKVLRNGHEITSPFSISSSACLGPFFLHKSSK